MSARPVFVLRLEAKPGTDPIRALRSLLKIAGRQFNLRCVDAYEIPQPQPERTRANGKNLDQRPSGGRRDGYADSPSDRGSRA